MTPVLVVLMVSPKLSQAEEKRSYSCCIFSSVLACRRLGLNIRPSVLYLKGIPSSVLEGISIAAKTIRFHTIGHFWSGMREETRPRR